MRWFRFYDDALNDPKVQRLSPALFKHWVNLLCVASQSEPRGKLPDIDSLAFQLRLTPTRVKSLLTQLATAGLLDQTSEGRWAPHNWAGRQRQSDDVAERVKKHRAAVTRNVTSNVTDTLPRARATETETDTETETPPAPPTGNSPPPSSYEQQLNSHWPEFARRFQLLDSLLDEGWLRYTLRRIEADVGSVSPSALKRGLGLAHRQLDLRLTAARKDAAAPIHSPRKFAETVITESLKEQRDAERHAHAAPDRAAEAATNAGGSGGHRDGP